MTKKAQTPETDILVESKGKIESFFDKYGNKLMWALVAITVIAVGIFIWSNISSQKAEAHEQEAQIKFFEVLNASGVTNNTADSFSVDYATTAESYMAIANEYVDTAAGNTSYFMAASSYLYAGDIANAKAAIAKFQDIEGNFGKHINAMALALKGDIAVEEKDYQSAAANFEQALAASHNADIYGSNAAKLGLVYEAMGDEAKAQEVYKAATAKYPTLANKFAKYIKE